METNTLFTGKNILRLKSVDSTNSYLQKIHELSYIPEGTIVIATEQLGGRGQRGNNWISETGKNLTFSVFLQPKFLSTPNHFLLNKIISLALSDLLETLVGNEIKIKWPNDVLIDGKKVCGILIENSISGNIIQYSIVGIGLNVNQTSFKNLPSASSLKLLSGKDFNLEKLLMTVSSFIEKRYLQLRAAQAEQINKDYYEKLFLLNKPANYLFKGQQISAAIKGVSVSGKLRLEKSGGEKIEADFKEIVFL